MNQIKKNPMKTIFYKWILLMLISMMAFGSSAQTVPDYVYHNRLFYLCKVWGHAKYYHTEIAKGNINWDNALLPTVTAAKTALTDEDFNLALLDMLNSAGPVQLPCQFFLTA
jgi:hypothetical protein